MDIIIAEVKTRLKELNVPFTHILKVARETAGSTNEGAVWVESSKYNTYIEEGDMKYSRQSFQ